MEKNMNVLKARCCLHFTSEWAVELQSNVLPQSIVKVKSFWQNYCQIKTFIPNSESMLSH